MKDLLDFIGCGLLFFLFFSFCYCLIIIAASEGLPV